MTMTLLGKKGVYRCNQVQKRSYWIRVALYPMIGVFTRRPCTDTGVQKNTGRMPCDDRGRDWSNVTTSQGMLQEAGREA